MKKRLLLVTELVSKSGEHRLLAALEKGMAGVRLLVVQESPRMAVPARGRKKIRPLLSPRQKQVLAEIARGTSTAEIARLLRLSPKTIETHRLQITERLGTRRIPELLRYALRTGLLKPDWLLER